MDLRLEKADLLRALNVPESEADAFHFTHPPAEEALETVNCAMDAPFARRNQAHIDSIRYIAAETELVPLGMAIGPFSLTTKLMADPITAVALSGVGMTGEDEPAVLTLERCHALACKAVERSLAAQIQAGARAVIICEPAANVVYFSPKHLEAGAGTFERFVVQPLLMLKRQLQNAGADLILHDCGELTGGMVREFGCRVRPAVLSLGSCRKLWEDAALVPKDVVLFGNLPTKSFYSDSVMNTAKVREITCELLEKMRATGHPFILGSECDVLHVPEAAETIRNKVDVMLSCGMP
jgi:uroporphyrinogen-III decarboxylase